MYGGPPQAPVPQGNVAARAIHQYIAAQPGDLSFEPGDLIFVISQDASGWWFGRTQDGRQGVFPYNRVQIQAPNANAAPARPLPPQQIIDRVNQVNVRPCEPIPLSGHLFEVNLMLSNGDQVTGRKTMKDFRILNTGLNQILNTSTGIGATSKAQHQNPEAVQMIPEWADEMSFPNQMAVPLVKERGRILNSFIEHVLGDSKIDYLIVYWLNPNARFSIAAQQKQEVGNIYRSAQDFVRKSPSPRNPPMALATYVWTRQHEQEINLERGEIVAFEQNTMYQGWWNGEKVNGARGLFPFNYVKVLNENEVSAILQPGSTPKAATPLVLPSSPGGTGGATSINPFFNGGNGGIMGAPEITDETIYKPTPSTNIRKPSTTPQNEPRARQRIEKYSLSCTEAFDELLTDGITIEIKGKWQKLLPNRDCPQPGDTVKLAYSAFIWEPQKQQLLEFAASDKLISNSSNGNRIQDGPLEFTMGKDMAIDGVERAAARMKLNQTIRVTLAPHMAYGEVGDPPDIPGNAYLVYDLTLTEMKKGSGGGNHVHNEGARRAPVAQRDDGPPQRGFIGGQSMRQLNENVSARLAMSGRQRAVNVGGQTFQSGVSPDHFKKQLTLEKLQSIVQNGQFAEYGINIAIIEEYLSDDEFTRAFKTNRQMWLLMPAYQRNQRKKEAGLI